MSIKLVLFVGWVAAASAGIVQPLGYSPIGGAPIISQFQAPFARIQHPIADGYGFYSGYGGQLVSPGPQLVGAPLPVTRISTPIAKTVASQEYDPNPQYVYSYEVIDASTGDNKRQSETRNGDLVEGSYALNDPDGTRRTVDYTADANGFNAVVRKEPLGAPGVANIAAGPLTISPAYTKIHAAPLLRTSPLTIIH